MSYTDYKKTHYSKEVEEIIRLYYGTIPMNNLLGKVQKAMGRTVTMRGLKLKILRMGLEPYKIATNAITLKDIEDAFNLSHSCVFYWVKNLGLPAKKVKGINGYVVNPKKFWEWAKNHKGIDFSRYTKGSILPEPLPDPKTGKSWLDNAIKESWEKKHARLWTETDTRTLIRLKNQGLSYKEIQKYLPHKTERQIGRKAHKLKRIGASIYVRAYIPVTEEEKDMIWNMRQQGYTLQQIADEFSRDEGTIRKYLRILEKEKQQKGSC